MLTARVQFVKTTPSVQRKGRVSMRVMSQNLMQAKASKKAPTKAPEPEEEDIGTVGLVAAGAGLALSPITIWSAYTLATTGAGLPEGPGGLLGAAEGISYLAVVGIVGWSAYTKVTTGSGLPAGPSGLLGGAEGLSYLALLAAIVAFAVKSFA